MYMTNRLSISRQSGSRSGTSTVQRAKSCRRRLRVSDEHIETPEADPALLGKPMQKAGTRYEAILFEISIWRILVWAPEILVCLAN